MEKIDKAKDQEKYTKKILWKEMGQKPKSRTIKGEKLERKKYKEQCKGDVVMAIRKKEKEQLMCPLCETED